MTTAFSDASTGIPGLDAILNGLRWGDNVVWQIEDIRDYQDIVTPFVEHAIAINKPVVYIHFGQHEPLIPPNPHVKEYQLDARVGFETFTSRVHAIVMKEGEGVCYVFDSLTELLSMWVTDLMIGNFFRVTCPYLFNSNCISYFALVKYSHSYATLARVRETTQLFLNLVWAGDHLYIHPRKVWKRYSPTMFFPHMSQGDQLVPITSSAETTQYLNRFECRGPGNVERYLDSWDRVFLAAQELIEAKINNSLSYKMRESAMVDRLCTLVLGHDKRVLSLAREYFTLEDLLKIRHRLVGSGFIGGKAVGMLLARKILEKNPEANKLGELEPHDSFYIGSDVYYTYLIENDCWELFQQQKLPDNYFSLAQTLQEKILTGVMPEIFCDQIKLMLDYYGQSPIIVRSSSLLEDGFGNAFAGKYESVFCVNQGSPEERYENFEKAVKKIFASTMNEDALTYRLQRGMADSNEQMALLVQRVSGSLRSHYFFPDLAGVALSHNPYTWHEDMDSEAGMVRLVLGLGTRAVDRVDDDYPRVLALDKPNLRPVSNSQDVSRFSQRKVDLLDIGINDLSTASLDTVSEQMSELSWWNAVAQPDYHKMNVYKEIGR
ncbi:MAG: PEP/pyruvate-binding domain-containing protein, partial [Chitinophagales bacterium]